MENSSGQQRVHLRDIEAYRISFALSNRVWKLVLSWSSFAQQTVGGQFIRAVDSISANLAEGFGRHSKKDKIRFYRIARGSLFETLDWTEKAYARRLLPDSDYAGILQELKRLPKSINTLIKITNNSLSQ